MGGTKITAWLCLITTVVLEVIGTVTLKFSQGFTVPVPSMVSISAYATAVVMLAFALKRIPMSVAYIVWTGVGTAGVVVSSAIIFHDALTVPSWAGVVLVIGGVVMIHAHKTSRTTPESNAPEEHTERPRTP